MSVPKQYLDPEIECASTDEMRQLQTERLKHMVKHAYENVPLYQERMDAMGYLPTIFILLMTCINYRLR